MKNSQCETLDITDELSYYFESIEEFKNFYTSVEQHWKSLQTQEYDGITFNIHANNYSEYGDSYTDIQFYFDYNRLLTEQELAEIEANRIKREEQDKVHRELIGKLSSNSIGSIMQNDDLRKLYLEGKIQV